MMTTRSGTITLIDNSQPVRAAVAVVTPATRPRTRRRLAGDVTCRCQHQHQDTPTAPVSPAPARRYTPPQPLPQARKIESPQPTSPTFGWIMTVGAMVTTDVVVGILAAVTWMPIISG